MCMHTELKKQFNRLLGAGAGTDFTYLLLESFTRRKAMTHEWTKVSNLRHTLVVCGNILVYGTINFAICTTLRA